jgi:hypothetical protein
LARVRVDISALPEQLDLENPLHYSKLRDLD